MSSWAHAGLISAALPWIIKNFTEQWVMGHKKRHCSLHLDMMDKSISFVSSIDVLYLLECKPTAVSDNGNAQAACSARFLHVSESEFLSWKCTHPIESYAHNSVVADECTDVSCIEEPSLCCWARRASSKGVCYPCTSRSLKWLPRLSAEPAKSIFIIRKVAFWETLQNFFLSWEQ